MEIGVECADDAVFAPSVFEDLLVPGSAQIALTCVDNVPAVSTQQLDRWSAAAPGRAAVVSRRFQRKDLIVEIAGGEI
jgi:hypothetical protein